MQITIRCSKAEARMDAELLDCSGSQHQHPPNLVFNMTATDQAWYAVQFGFWHQVLANTHVQAYP